MMATTTAQKTSAPTTIDAAKVAKVSHDSAVRVAKYFDDTKSTFDRARELAKAVKAGASLEAVASELSMIRAMAAYPEATEVELEYYAGSASGKGGTQISKASLHAYASAWVSVSTAKLSHDPELVGLAFRLMSKGGTANGRKEAEKRAGELVDAGKVDEARTEYVRAGRLNLRGVDPYNTPSAPTVETVDGEPVELSTETPAEKLNVEAILGQIKSWETAELSASDLDRIFDAIAKFAQKKGGKRATAPKPQAPVKA